MDGIGGGLGEQGWYSPSGGNGPVAEMDGHANGWAALEDQIPVGPHEGNGLKSWPIGEHPQMDFGSGLGEGTQKGDNILSAVMGWGKGWHAEDWGGDGDLG